MGHGPSAYSGQLDFHACTHLRARAAQILHETPCRGALTATRVRAVMWTSHRGSSVASSTTIDGRLRFVLRHLGMSGGTECGGLAMCVQARVGAVVRATVQWLGAGCVETRWRSWCCCNRSVLS